MNDRRSILLAGLVLAGSLLLVGGAMVFDCGEAERIPTLCRLDPCSYRECVQWCFQTPPPIPVRESADDQAAGLPPGDGEACPTQGGQDPTPGGAILQGQQDGPVSLPAEPERTLEVSPQEGRPDPLQ